MPTMQPIRATEYPQTLKIKKQTKRDQQSAVCDDDSAVKPPPVINKTTAVAITSIMNRGPPEPPIIWPIKEKKTLSTNIFRLSKWSLTREKDILSPSSSSSIEQDSPFVTSTILLDRRTCVDFSLKKTYKRHARKENCGQIKCKIRSTRKVGDQ